MIEPTSQLAIPIGHEVVVDEYVINRNYARATLVFAVIIAAVVCVILALLISGVIPMHHDL